MHKIGRPRIKDNKKRKHTITCRLTDKELIKLNKNKPSKYRMGEWLRILALQRNFAIPPEVPEFNKEIWRKLNKNFTNLNQIMRYINKVEKTENELFDHYKTIKNIIKLIHNLQNLLIVGNSFPYEDESKNNKT